VRLAGVGLLIVLLAPAMPAQQYEPGDEGTFSIIGRDPNTGQLGMAVHSKTIAVGSRTRGGKGGLAVFAHQSAPNPMYSTIGIDLLEAGFMRSGARHDAAQRFSYRTVVRWRSSTRRDARPRGPARRSPIGRATSAA
jgi:hypothetical protein